MAISELAAAITHCRFEATDHAEDDAVLLKILSLMEEIVCGVGRDMLNDESVCDIIETCLSMACQMRRGDLLRRSAEMTMIKLTEAVFLRLSDIEPEVVIDAMSVENSELQMLEPGNNQDPTTKLSEEYVHVMEVPDEPDKYSVHEHINKPFEKYGLASVREYFRVLISIIDNSNFHQYNDATRIMALHLINVAFEVSGKNIIKHESLLNLTTDILLKHILQLVRVENPHLLQKALRVFCTIISTVGEYLKLHQELFLTYFLTCLSPMVDIPREEGVDGIFYDGVPSVPRTVLDASPRVATPVISASLGNPAKVPSFVTIRSPDSREMMVESISSLTRMPSFFVNLFVNYDCDVDRADLCEDMVGFLCRNAYPDSTTWSTSTVPPLCLEAILGYLFALVNRLTDSPLDKEEAEEAMRNKARKKLVIEGTESFNKNPTDGLHFLVKHKLIPDDRTVSAVKFLRQSGRINKKLLGEFLAKPKNKHYLDLFIEDFDFSNTPLDEAMRELFASFRLPGESQQIERIIEKFAEQYIAGENNIKDVADKDSAFILSYAVIMLNTDLHNPQNKHLMTNEQFKRNLRSTNAGNDFAPEYLDNIYYTIKHREIIMPEEHNNEESFEQTWKDVLLKSQQVGNLKMCSTSIYDKDMFESTWQPVVTMLAYVFATATEDAIFSRVITGFDHVAKIASHYQIPGVLDQITSALCKISTLSFGDLSVPSSTIQIQIEKDKLIVSDLSIQFGQDFKAQLAVVVLFRLAKANPEALHDCWSDMVPVLANLYLYALMSPEFSKNQQKIGLPFLPVVTPTHVIQRSRIDKEVVGLFSTLSSYLTGYNDATPEPTDEEVDATLCTTDCINSCSVTEFLQNVLAVSPPSVMQDIINSITEVLPSLTEMTPDVRQKFYPVSLFLLELATLVAIDSNDSNIVKTVINMLQQRLQEVDDEATLIRLMVYYLVTLRHASIEFLPELEKALETMNQIDSELLSPCVPPLVISLAALADEGAWSCEHVLKMKAFWSLHQIAASNRESAGAVFSFVGEIVNISTKEITADNVVSVLQVLGEVASVGASGAQLEQDKTAIAIEFRKKFDQPTAIQKAKEVIAYMEEDVQRAIEAVDLIHQLGPVVDQVAEDQNVINWTDVWFPYTRTLSQQCINPCRAIRLRAWKWYQQAVLSPTVHARADFNWVNVFGQALFPLMDALLKEEVYETDPVGMARTRLRAASLLCKVLLQYVVRTGGEGEMLDLWTKVLDILDQLVSNISADNQSDDELEESVQESVKNLLLVMQASESGQAQEETFWIETWKRVEVIIPGLKDQLVIDTATSPVTSVSTEESTKVSANDAPGDDQESASEPIEKDLDVADNKELEENTV